MEIRVPGDKSISHRALLLGALARGGSRVRGLLPGADPSATGDILRALGVPVPLLPADGAEIRIPGVGLRGLRPPSRVLDCVNSGTTARLLLGILAPQPLEATLTGDESLRKRPMRRVTGPLSAMGAVFRELGEPGCLPIQVRGGTLSPTAYDSPVSSAQVKSALLLAGLTGGVPVTVTEPGRSRDHTERMLAGAGVTLEEGPEDGGRWRVALPSPPGSISGLDLTVPGDPSSAAFLVAWSLLAGVPLTVRDAGVNPTRIGFLPVLRRMGGRIAVEGEALEGGEPVGTLVVDGGALRATELGGDEIPALIDEIPILAMVAARAEGVTRITGAGELRVKESDRIRAVVENLRAVGVEAEELPDGLVVRGADGPLRGRVRTHHDHRIAMAFGVLGSLPGNAIDVEDAGVVDVSFPGFWELLAALRAGGEIPPGARPARVPASVSAGSAPRRPVVTVDGPAGSGKSSTAREVARRLGFRHLDSGALYRGLTVALRERGVPEDRWASLTVEELDDIALRLEPSDGGFRVLLGDRVLEEELRDPGVTARVSALAGLPAVRARLLRAQREAGADGGLVADGRDMGTVVFPGAEVKVFLTADLEERARRRLLQDGVDPDTPGRVAEEARRLEERDRRDRERALSPLREPAGALVLDTTRRTLEEQVRAVVDQVETLTSD